MTTFAEALQKACEARGLDIAGLARVAGCSFKTATLWLDAVNKPSGPRLVALAKAMPELGPLLGSQARLENGLPKAQQRVLECIEKSLRERGFAPTLRELCRETGVRSTNGMDEHLRALERKGFIDRDRKKARGMVVVRSATDRQDRIRKLREEIAAKQALLAQLEAEGL